MRMILLFTLASLFIFFVSLLPKGTSFADRQYKRSKDEVTRIANKS